jgi:hypothetical protein
MSGAYSILPSITIGVLLAACLLPAAIHFVMPVEILLRMHIAHLAQQLSVTLLVCSSHHRESEEEDFDVMWPHEFARRLRNSCQ